MMSLVVRAYLISILLMAISVPGDGEELTGWDIVGGVAAVCWFAIGTVELLFARHLYKDNERP